VVNEKLTTHKGVGLVMGTTYFHNCLLISAVAFFAILALDIAVPAAVLSGMALLRWAVSLEIGPAIMARGAA